MQILPPKPINIFCTGARQDRAFHHELKKQLDSLEHMGRITHWHDMDVQAGTVWAEEIYAHLKVADIILLLISPHFMHSEYRYHVLITQALERHNSGEALVLPIIVRATLLEGTPISELAKIPIGGKPINQWRRHGDAIFDVVSYIFNEVNALLSERWLNESNIYYDSKLYEEALMASEQAINLNPNNISAHMSKGAILWHSSYFQEALKVYEQIIHLNPNDIAAHISKAYVLLNLSRFQEALIACEQAIYLDSTIDIAYLIKSYLHKMLATQANNKAREIGTNQWQPHLTNKYFIARMEKEDPKK